MKNKKKKKLKQKKRILILILLLIILLFFLFFLRITFNRDYYSIESRLDKVKEVKLKNDADFETAGWLRIQGTNIDYPILYSEKQSGDFPAEEEAFLWTIDSDKKFHNYISVVGHNIFNLSSTPKITSDKFYRFEELMAFVYYDFVDKNKYIQLTLDGKEVLYKIYAIGFKSNSYLSTAPWHDDYTEEELDKEIKFSKDNSIYDFDVDVSNKDNYITLTTCTRFFGANDRTIFYVNGRLVREDEKIENYNVSKNKKYKEIENKLKGDGSNEEENV